MSAAWTSALCPEEMPTDSPCAYAPKLGESFPSPFPLLLFFLSSWPGAS